MPINKRNLKKGDIVLLKIDSSRNHWPLCKVLTTYPDEKGNVRSVSLMVGNNVDNNKHVLNRPISKIVLVLEVERFPDVGSLCQDELYQLRGASC